MSPLFHTYTSMIVEVLGVGHFERRESRRDGLPVEAGAGVDL